MTKKLKKVMPKQEIRLVKASTLTKAEFGKIKMEELWIINPADLKAVTKARLCGCRNVCIA